MDYEQQPIYETPRPAPPFLWIGLTAFFALCCCFFFGIAGFEAMVLTGMFGPTGTNAPSTTAAKPTIGEIKFYKDKTGSNTPSGSVVSTVPLSTTTVYAFFTYKNMPKTGATWSYLWLYNGSDIPTASKSDQRWTREGNGTFYVSLTDDKGLKPGDYDLSILLNGDEVATGTIHVGP
jgi:hypothetical protein